MVDSIVCARRDAARLELHRATIETAARAHGLAPAVLAAVISRESGAGVFLDASGLGDGGHGHGLTQIDDRSFDAWCASWRMIRRTDPARADRMAITQGAKVLGAKLREIDERLPGLAPQERLAAGVAAYNCGAKRVAWALRHVLPVDHYTTGGDYSRDVLARAAWLEAHGWPTPAPEPDGGCSRCDP